jgi:hypothetical protein
MGLPTCLLLEYGVSTAAVAFGWSQSVNSCWTGVRHRAAQCRAARHGSWRSSPAGGDLVGFFVKAPPDETTTSPASPPRSASTGITVAARNRAARGGAHGVLADNRRPPSTSKVSSDPNDAGASRVSAAPRSWTKTSTSTRPCLFGSYVTAAHRRPDLPTGSVTRPRWRSPPRGPGG